MRRRIFLGARATPLPRSDIMRELQDMADWRFEGEETNSAICRDFEFRDFKEAMTFMNSAAAECEAMDHHPCWTNTYNRLHVRLTTHDSGNRVTQRDINLARQMNELLKASLNR